MKYLSILLIGFGILSFTSCEEAEEVITCPCIFQNEQPPYYKSCEQMGESEERWDCMSAALLAKVYENLRYPEEAKENCIEGTVIVGIEVNRLGSVSKREIRSDSLLGYGLEEEALRVVELLDENWCPGLINCETADMDFVFPIKYKLAK